MKRILLSLAVIMMLSSCYSRTRTGGLTVASTRNVNTKDVDFEKLTQHKNIVGKSKRFTFLFIPLGTPTIGEAVDDAIDQASGDVIIDASLYKTNFTLFPATYHGYEVKGTVFNTKAGGVK